MPISISLSLALVAALASGWLTPLVRRLAVRCAVLDQPNHRKIHTEPVPRLGGIAVFAAWVIAVGFGGTLGLLPESEFVTRLAPVLLAAGCSVLLGAWDDARDLPGRVKLAGQVAIGAILIAGDVRIDRISNPFGGEVLFPDWVSIGVTLFWVAGMMNAVNLIDGLDGLAAGIVGIASFGLAAAGLYTHNVLSVILFTALGGACAGFLLYNFHPAKIFLGDAGSQFLGLVLAAAPLVEFSYKSATAVALLIPLTSLALPIYDTALAFFRRVKGWRSIFRADRYHLHHRLLRMGLSHRQAVVFLYLVTLYLSVLAFVFVLIPERYAIILLWVLALGLVMAMQILRFIEWKVLQLARAKARQARRRARGAA